METLFVGQKVILLKSVFNLPVGTFGFVVETYPDFDDPNLTGATVIFSGGRYDGFSAKEQSYFFEIKDVDPRFSCYQFTNVGKLMEDFRKGYWNFNG